MFKLFFAIVIIASVDALNCTQYENEKNCTYSNCTWCNENCIDQSTKCSYDDFLRLNMSVIMTMIFFVIVVFCIIYYCKWIHKRDDSRFIYMGDRGSYRESEELEYAIL